MEMLGPQLRAAALEMMALMQSSSVSFEALENITARLYAKNPGIFQDAKFDEFVDMTPYVAKQRQHVEASCSKQSDSQHNNDQRHLGSIVAASTMCQLYRLINSKKLVVAVLHTPDTNWFFEARVFSGMLVSDTKNINLLLDIAYRGIMCPMLLLLPDYNEMEIAPQFATHPNDAAYLQRFETQFREFLLKSVKCDPTKMMTVSCETCHTETTGMLYTCEKCKLRMCSACIYRGECSCQPIVINLNNNETFAETTEKMMSAQSENEATGNLSLPKAQLQYMPTSVQSKSM